MPSEATALRQTIDAFINERLLGKLDKLKDEDRDKRRKLQNDYSREVWLADAAKRVRQIQLVTHNVKPSHPDARGSNIHLSGGYTLPPGLVGSTGESLTDDVVGNAAALDVYKFLKLEVNGLTLLERARTGCNELKAAFSDNAERANEWCEAFAGITQARDKPASHTLAKQVYFPLADGGYHLLAPLYPTALAHGIHQRIQEDRFGEAAVTARQARRNGVHSAIGYREYPNLAQRKFGGSKPQNISQLNSERGGVGYLLASCPPRWRNQGLKPPLHVSTVFGNWLRRWPAIRDETKALRSFLGKLGATDYTNVHIRGTRAEMVAGIVDQVLHLAAQVQSLQAGWSAGPDCRLDSAERFWLDPARAVHDEAFAKQRSLSDWPREVSHHFGNWLNAAIRSDSAPMGDFEHHEWQRQLDRELVMLQEVLRHDR